MYGHTDSEIDQISKRLFEQKDLEEEDSHWKLPMKIYCTLSDVAISPKGELTLYLSKKNKFMLEEFLKDLHDLVGEEIYLYLNVGRWKNSQIKEI